MEKQQLNQTKTTIASQQANKATNTLPTTHPILQLQADIGNRAVNQLLEAQRRGSQLTPDKPSHDVLNSRLSGITPSIQSPIQAKEPFRGLYHELTGKLQQQGEVLPLATGGGKKMPEAVQQKMETAFGTDFSDVRIHEGKEAESIGAIAYTRGRDIHFAPGKYDSISQTGQELLGHELTHVVQQQAGQVAAPQGKDIPINAEPQLELEADVLGAKAAQGKQVQVAGAGTRLGSTVALDAGQVVQCGSTPGFLKTPARHLKKKLLALQSLGYLLAGEGNRAVANARRIKRIEQKLNADRMRRNPSNFRSTVDEMERSSHQDSEDEIIYNNPELIKESSQDSEDEIIEKLKIIYNNPELIAEAKKFDEKHSKESSQDSEDEIIEKLKIIYNNPELIAEAKKFDEKHSK